MENFSSRIQILRNGMTFKAFERVTGIPAATLQYIEKTNSDIKSGQIIKLCKCFGVTSDWLLGIDGEAADSGIRSTHSAVSVNGNASYHDCSKCELMRAAAQMMKKRG